MKLLELNLQAFGAFTETSLNLSGNSGLQVIYGPNEAGKSTAMRAVQAALFGFPHQSKDTFIHPKPIVGATIEANDGTTLSFSRRKGRKNTILHPTTESALPDDSLSAFLHGLDFDTFSRTYTIDLAELERGGEEMRMLRGLVGESLFATSLGGIGLTKLLSNLDDEAAEIFSSKKRKHQIASLRRDYQAVDKEKKNSTLQFSKWQKLQAEWQEAVSKRDEIVASLNQFRVQEKRIERIRQSLSPLAQRRQLIDRLTTFQHTTILPTDYSAQERSRVEGEIAQLNPQIESLQQELDGESGLRQRLRQIHVSQQVLDQEVEINQLQERLGACQKAKHDRDNKLSIERSHHVDLAQRILKDLNIDRPIDKIEEFRITPEQRVQIQNMGNHEKGVTENPVHQEQKRRRLQTELDAATTELANLNVHRDLSDLEALCSEIRSQRISENDIEQLEHATETLCTSSENALNSLGLWRGDLKAFAKTKVPFDETIDRFIDLTSEAIHEKRQLEESIANQQDELAEIQEDIVALKKATNVVTEDELIHCRSQRDACWSRVQSNLSNGSVSESARASIAEFSRLLVSADEIADRLRREAERVERLAQLLARQAKVNKQLNARHADLEKWNAKSVITDNEWRSIWQASEIEAPLPPTEMRAWVARQAEIKKQIADIHDNEAEIKSKRNKIAEFKTKLLDAAKSIGLHVKTDATLAAMLDRFTREIEREKRQQQSVLELQVKISRLNSDIESVAAERESAIEDLERWQTKWTVVMKQIGVSPDTSAAEANERVNQLTRVFDEVQQIQEIDRRGAGIDKELAEFAAEVTSVLARTNLSSEDSPFDSTIKLRKALNEAKTNDSQSKNLQASIEQKQNQLTLAISQRDERIGKLNQLCKQAGVLSVDELPVVEKQSAEFNECRLKLEDIENRLQDLAGELTVDRLESEANDQSSDQLQIDLENLQLKITELETQRDEAVAAVREMENLVEQANGEPLAAAADQRALGILGQMQQAAARFVRLRIASAVLRQQIEKHRAENEDPLLAKASDYFSQVTCGDFRGLKSQYENDEAVLMGLRKNEDLVSVDQMSTGTRDQLYLSLRLAYLQSRITEEFSMPIVVDDILVQFDDQRALSTLNVLAELSQQTQIILFTHHRRIVDLVKKIDFSDCCRVHELQRRKLAV